MSDWYENEQLHIAADHGDLDRVRRLVAEGRDVNAFDEDLAFTPLHYAAKSGNIETVKFLLDSGADINAHDEQRIGETPLGEIASNCSYEMASVLINSGANPTIEGWMQLTAIDRARKRKNIEGMRVCDLLVRVARERFKYTG